MSVVSVWSVEELAEAVAGGAQRVWVTAPGVVPEEGALDALVAAAGEEDAIVAGLVVDRAGAPVDALLPGAPEGDPAGIIAAAPRRVLPLRWTPVVHAVVARSAVERCGVPDVARFGPFAGVEWSARVLREQPGVLVPASVARLTAPAPALDRRARLQALRLARAGALTPGEALRAAARRSA